MVWPHVSPARVFPAFYTPCMQACDIEVQFKRPTATTTVSVHTTGGTFFMNYTAGDTVQVGFAAARSNLAANLETATGSGKGRGMVDTVTMLASDTVISFRIFLDTNVGEVRCWPGLIQIYNYFIFRLCRWPVQRFELDS